MRAHQGQAASPRARPCAWAHGPRTLRCRVPVTCSLGGHHGAAGTPQAKHPFAYIQNLSGSLFSDLSLRCRSLVPPLQAAAGGGSSGGGSNSGGGDGGGGDGEGEDDEGNRVLSLKEVEAFMKEKNVTLPADMLEAAKNFGLRLSVLNAFVESQKHVLSGFLARTVPFFRDRILADPRFLFKVAVEVAIDSGCTTVAEVRKRGADFWGEFELYMSDLMVGLALDVVLVGLMAPVAVLGGAQMAAKASGLRKILDGIPSAVFAASVPGVKVYSLAQRLSCILVKFCEYSLAGIFCGFVGQGIANAAMEAHRKSHKVDDNAVAIPPLFKTALVWGLFMGVSSNLRYQTVFGIERLVDVTIAKNIPMLAYVTTVIVRFSNNVIGGENFIDMARWAGVQ